MKKLLFLSALFLIGASSFSQVKFGVKAGLNLSNIGQNFKDPADEFSTNMKPGVHLGLAVQYDLGESLGLLTGLVYSSKGFKIEEGTYKSKASLGYLEIPIKLAYKLNNFRFMVGPSIAFGISGKSKWEYDVDSGEDKIKFKNKLGEAELNDDYDYVKAIDLGLNIGVGYDINGILISANYGLGLSNLNPKVDVPDVTDDSKDYKMTNRVISIGVTYFFGD